MACFHAKTWDSDGVFALRLTVCTCKACIQASDQSDMHTSRPATMATSKITQSVSVSAAAESGVISQQMTHGMHGLSYPYHPLASSPKIRTLTPHGALNTLEPPMRMRLEEREIATAEHSEALARSVCQPIKRRSKLNYMTP